MHSPLFIRGLVMIILRVPPEWTRVVIMPEKTSEYSCWNVEFTILDSRAYEREPLCVCGLGKGPFSEYESKENRSIQGLSKSPILERFYRNGGRGVSPSETVGRNRVLEA